MSFLKKYSISLEARRRATEAESDNTEDDTEVTDDTTDDIDDTDTSSDDVTDAPEDDADVSDDMSDDNGTDDEDRRTRRRVSPREDASRDRSTRPADIRYNEDETTEEATDLEDPHRPDRLDRPRVNIDRRISDTDRRNFERASEEDRRSVRRSLESIRELSLKEYSKGKGLNASGAKLVETTLKSCFNKVNMSSSNILPSMESFNSHPSRRVLATSALIDNIDYYLNKLK